MGVERERVKVPGTKEQKIEESRGEPMEKFTLEGGEQKKENGAAKGIDIEKFRQQ
jgi:hypothetical protein